jgi:DNA-binding transcriptional LysR family regulator
MAPTQQGGRAAATRPLTEDLEALVAVVDGAGLGGAARALGVPKTTVSRRVQRLEAALGVQLLARGRQAVRLTDAGHEVVERARASLAALDALADAAARRQAQPQGRLRLSAPADLAAQEDVWVGFLARFPEVELQIEFTNRYVDVVREGYDLAVRGGRGDDEALMTRRLGSYALRAVASPGWAAANPPLAAPAELRQRSCVLLRPFSGDPSPPPGGRHLVFNQLALVLRAAAEGHGVAILPAPLVQAELDAGRLVTVLAAYDPLVVPVYAAFAGKRHLSAAAEALMAHLQAAFGAGAPG